MRRGTVTILLGLCLFALTGCWDHQPVEQSAFVVMLGLDEDPMDPSHTILTQMIVLPQAQPQGSVGGQGGATPYYLSSASGITISESQTEVLRHVPRFIELAHAQDAVLGEAFARSGVDEALDWLLRQPQVRLGLSVMVSRSTAQELMQAQPILEPLPPSATRGVLRVADPVAITYDVLLHEFARKMLSEREDAVAPLIDRIDPLTISAESGSTASAGAKANEIYAVGLAVFKGYRMVGTLEGAASRGAVWLHNRSLATINVPHPERENRFISVNFVKTRSKLNVSANGDELTIRINVSVNGNVFEVGLSQSIAAGRYLDEIQKAVEDAIKKEVEAALSEVQLLGSDVFGVAEQLYRSSPDDWHRLKDYWEEVYRQAMVEVTVEAKISRTGLGA